ncbi:MAG TPA: DUF1236 domain-containing protein [Xanthobacteraceae bacterium]|nr:DUF1236 domain-containing protein [Xanthobacteraceae bacterium]
MNSRDSIPLIAGAVMLTSCLGGFHASAQTGTAGGTAEKGGDVGVSGALEQKLILNPAQRQAIYEEVSKDKSKTASKSFSPVIGADVPPMIELYALPDDAVASVPAAKLYQYTMVDNKVILVDPTKMRIIDVIGPAGAH